MLKLLIIKYIYFSHKDILNIKADSQHVSVYKLLIKIFLILLKQVSLSHQSLYVHLPFHSIQPNILNLRLHYEHSLVILEIKIVIYDMR